MANEGGRRWGGGPLTSKTGGKGRDEGKLETFLYAAQGFERAASADRLDIFTNERVQLPAGG